MLRCVVCHKLKNDANTRNDALVLYLKPDVTANDVLGAIAANPDVTVDRFELAVPSLNDIFIDVVGERVLETGETETLNV